MKLSTFSLSLISGDVALHFCLENAEFCRQGLPDTKGVCTLIRMSTFKGKVIGWM